MACTDRQHLKEEAASEKPARTDSAEESVVFRVTADPEPDEPVVDLYRKRTMTASDSRRPDPPSLLEAE
jgi:hypothetical protein